MQGARAGFQYLRSFSSSRSFHVAPRSPTSISMAATIGARAFSQPASGYVPLLQKNQVAARVMDLLKSIPFIDPAKVTATASFRGDLQLDILDNVQVLKAVEKEFAVGIPDNEAYKISNIAHLIDYIAAHPQAN